MKCNYPDNAGLTEYTDELSDHQLSWGFVIDTSKSWWWNHQTLSYLPLEVHKISSLETFKHDWTTNFSTLVTTKAFWPWKSIPNLPNMVSNTLVVQPKRRISSQLQLEIHRYSSLGTVNHDSIPLVSAKLNNKSIPALKSVRFIQPCYRIPHLSNRNDHVSWQLPLEIHRLSSLKTL